jgi:hypothetical protein
MGTITCNDEAVPWSRSNPVLGTSWSSLVMAAMATSLELWRTRIEIMVDQAMPVTRTVKLGIPFVPCPQSFVYLKLSSCLYPEDG